jgi:hypothetical protein
MKRLTFAALCLCLAAPVAAQPTAEEMQLPPMSYQNMTFVHPNGCVYTRADAPGFPRRWHAISNGTVLVAGARSGTDCTTILTQPGGAMR